MQRDSFRRTIRARTSAVHAQLDDATGVFQSVADYGRFMQRTHCFRAATEQALSTNESGEWMLKPGVDPIELDLVDLGVSALAPASFTLRNSSRWARLGTHYVLEGSSLGARLLVRRAADLGFGAQFGARYLSQQAQDTARWDAFLTELENSPVAVRDDVVSAAEESFQFALSIYAEEVCA